MNTTLLRTEKNFLGCLLRSPHEFWAVQDVVAPEMFSTGAHRDLYGAIRDIAEKGRQVSTSALLAHLPEEYEDVGPSIGFLEVLKMNAMEAGSATDYAPSIAEHSARSRLEQLGAWLAKEAKSTSSNAEDVAARAAVALSEIMAGAAPIRPIKLSDATQRVITASLATIESGAIPGFNTGLDALDDMIGQIMGGDFIAVLAALGEGKSGLIAQLCGHIAGKFGPVLICHNEMGVEQSAVRAIAGQAGMSVRAVREGAFDFAGYELIKDAQKEIEKLPIHIYFNPRMTIRAIKVRAIHMQRTIGLKALAVDGGKRLKTEGKFKDQWERKEEITGALKELALELNVPLLAAFQRTRFARRRDDPTPHLDDAEFPALEHDADVILGLWREESWLMMNKPPAKAGAEAQDEWEGKIRRAKGVAKIIGLKIRSSSPFETREFKWNGPATRLENL